MLVVGAVGSLSRFQRSRADFQFPLQPLMSPCNSGETTFFMVGWK